MKVYQGGERGRVTVNGESLDPRLDLRTHATTGFSWGDTNSEATQLALAILANEVGDQAAMTRSLYQIFKHEIIANLPAQQPFQLTSEEVRQWYIKTVPEPSGAIPFCMLPTRTN